jgi:hypothetical protein
MKNKKSIKEIAKDVLAMARGTLVIDECAKQLAIPLSLRNIHIIEPIHGEKDDDIIKRLLPNRIIVTKNVKDFKDYASSFDFGIIDISKLKFIDSEKDPIKNETVKIISKALSDYSIWSKRHGFILTLHDSGKHTYQDLID